MTDFNQIMKQAQQMQAKLMAEQESWRRRKSPEPRAADWWKWL